MRKYYLVSSEYRNSVDLRDYEQVITDSVHSEMPDTKVTIYAEYYTLDEQPTRGQAIRIGRKIAGSSLGEYCMIRPILFIGKNIEDII